ncbi:MAG: hypothetical protein NWF06_10180 [Candidatus Bathyarchaeota archaeon]|nr:hypothetical protein [Candidatus Bathyarchaeum sp.]
MDASGDVQTLTDLGLTSSQAKVYLAICQKKSLDASEISKVSNIARSDVYRIISALQRLALVEKEINYPFKFKAIPIETGLNILFERQSKKHNKLKYKIDSLITKFNNKTLIDEPFQGESKFILVPSKEAIIQRLRESIDKAKKSIDVVTLSKRFMLACSYLSESLEQAWFRGVTGRVVIEETEASLFDVVNTSWQAPSAQVGFVSVIPKTLMAMYDNKEVFIYVKPTVDLKLSPAIWSNNPSLVTLAEDHFEFLWQKARKNALV